MENIIVSLITGALGGNAAGALFKRFSLGLLGNTVAGIIGGGVGSQILSAVMGSGAPAGLGGNIAGSGVGGLLALVVVGVIKDVLNKKTT